ncbi:MAG TPA: hypothetical protein VFH88_03290 [Candidatus Krumholzibacteria bacterium]|nr:hypothetical protein [Candidatus Krumholzibacteria bacterium]
MKRVLLCTIAVLMLAGLAVAAGDMTPQQVMDKVMNCPVCSAWNPVAQNIRYDIFSTKTGTIESFVNANAAEQDKWDACAVDCEKRMEGVPSMTADQKAMLCPMCQARMGLMSTKDVSVQNFKTHTGFITVSTWTSPAGQKALNEYATSMKNTSEMLEAAAKAMDPGTMKSKM